MDSCRNSLDAADAEPSVVALVQQDFFAQEVGFTLWLGETGCQGSGSSFSADKGYSLIFDPSVINSPAIIAQIQQDAECAIAMKRRAVDEGHWTAL